MIAGARMSQDVFIIGAVRTPIGRFGGGLAELTAAELGAIAVRAVLERVFGAAPPARVPGEFSAAPARLAGSAGAKNAASDAPPVDELIFGNARPAGVGPNVARQIAWRAGLAEEAPSFTVNAACASGLRAILLARDRIRLGEAQIVVAGGAEAMSRVPYLLDGRWGFKMGHQQVTDAMYRDGFLCPMSQMVMGETAEVLAELYGIPREEQDAYALESQQRAARAIAEGRFAAEIVPVERADRKGNVRRIATDEHVRADTSLASLAKLPPVFKQGGCVTAGNSSGLTDAAAALLLAGETSVRAHRLAPLARIVDAAIVAVDPRMMGVAPVPAVRQLAARTGWKLADYDAVELNEAFAAQVLACDRDLHFDRARLNPNGGAIALGHPIGCTGARITTTLLHQLRRSGGRRGLATLCVSGGLGLAVALEAA
jgi:acetyl-CoA C-acetyltransferase